MADRDREFLAKLLETFKGEARDHLEAISVQLGVLGQQGATAHGPAIEVAFRAAHSLKAAARAVGHKDIERLCQAMEGVFAAFKRRDFAPSRAMLEALQLAADLASDLLAGIDGTADEASSTRASRLAAELDAIGATGSAPAAGTATPPDAAAPVVEPTTAGTIRLAAEKLDALLLQAEEMVSVKLAARRQAAMMADTASSIAAWRKDWNNAIAAREWRGQQRTSPRASTVLVAHPRLEQGLLELGQQQVSQLETKLLAAARVTAEDAREASVKVDELLEQIKRILMLECRTLLGLFPKVVRDLARDQGKQVALQIEGGELEIDRRTLDELKDPLLHLVRNCIDHGIEKPDRRRAAGKPEVATIGVAVLQADNDKVEITVTDDGSGVAREKLAQCAVKLGLLQPDRASTASIGELLPFMFESGFSTAPMVTDLSGRGLGLAIVREKLERLGGSIQVDSLPGRGTTFRLLVPMTLTTFRGVPVRVMESVFVVPTLGIESIVSVGGGNERTVENRRVLALNGAHLPLVRLADVLEMPAKPGSAPLDRRRLALVLGSAAIRVAFDIDDVEADQEVLVRPLGSMLERVRNVLGATVLANGRVAPVLNVHDLLKSAGRVAQAPATTPGPAQPTPRAARKVLLAEDSITARGLLKNILESAGYKVTTAVDGLEAWMAMRLDEFDVVVSDVEMPRMNGFDLTARIRADSRFAALPVVLVTALDSREDRERGVDAGASAYIVKGDFDHTRLLEVLQRLT